MTDKTPLIHYLQLIYKLIDILEYMKNNSSEVPNQFLNDIKHYIVECKQLCIEKAKSEELMSKFLLELNNKEEAQTSTELNMFSLLNESNQQSSNQQLSNQQITSEMFDTLGSGLAKLFKSNYNDEVLTSSLVQPQIKNEINLSNTAISCQIKKKNG